MKSDESLQTDGVAILHGAGEESRAEIKTGRNKKFNGEKRPNITWVIPLGPVLPQQLLGNCSGIFFLNQPYWGKMHNFINEKFFELWQISIPKKPSQNRDIE